MGPGFDIFKADSEGSVSWIEATPDMETAKARIHVLTISSPGEYLVCRQETANRTSIKADNPGSSSSGSS
jgi:hypothetical protein